jgi:hypothetical protein
MKYIVINYKRLSFVGEGWAQVSYLENEFGTSFADVIEEVLGTDRIVFDNLINDMTEDWRILDKWDELNIESHFKIFGDTYLVSPLMAECISRSYLEDDSYIPSIARCIFQHLTS